MLFGKSEIYRFLLVPIFLGGILAVAQTPKYNLGRTPTAEESRAMGYTYDLSGKDLPPGSGNAKDGAKLFAQKCAACHGAAGEGSKAAPMLIGEKGRIKSPDAERTVGNFWPYPVPIWNYINRSMPVGQGGTLKADEVYSLTAFLLFKNDIIKDTDTLDAQTLPKIQMPNGDGFIPARLEDINRLHCRVGTCR